MSCAGKSTVAQMLAREKGYVYYEADCITMLCNPFPDLGADNLYDALMTSRPLKGWSRDVVFKQTRSGPNKPAAGNGRIAFLR